MQGLSWPSPWGPMTHPVEVTLCLTESTIQTGAKCLFTHFFIIISCSQELAEENWAARAGVWVWGMCLTFPSLLREAFYLRYTGNLFPALGGGMMGKKKNWPEVCLSSCGCTQLRARLALVQQSHDGPSLHGWAQVGTSDLAIPHTCQALCGCSCGPSHVPMSSWRFVAF